MNIVCETCEKKRRMTIVGQGFTKFICVRCGQEKQHPNTGVPIQCFDCSSLTERCQYCREDLSPDK